MSIEGIESLKGDSVTKTTKEVVEILRKHVEAQKLVDIGGSVERSLGISREKFRAAVYTLKDEGYGLFNVLVSKKLGDERLAVKLLADKGITQRQAYEMMKAIGESG